MPTAKFNVMEPRELSVNEPLGLLWYTLYSREESIPAADVLVTADAVAGLAAAADDPTAALYLEPAAEAEDETRQFLPARNGNNHSGGSGSGADHENGQV